MSIISLSPKGIKASESYNDSNIDDTATNHWIALWPISVAPGVLSKWFVRSV